MNKVPEPACSIRQFKAEDKNRLQHDQPVSTNTHVGYKNLQVTICHFFCWQLLCKQCVMLKYTKYLITGVKYSSLHKYFHVFYTLTPNPSQRERGL